MFGLCMATGVVFSVVWTFVAWLVDERLIYLMLPGLLLTNLWGSSPRFQNQILGQFVFVISNGLVWGAVFFGGLVLARRTRSWRAAR
jgi:hypothetical protein